MQTPLGPNQISRVRLHADQPIIVNCVRSFTEVKAAQVAPESAQSWHNAIPKSIQSRVKVRPKSSWVNPQSALGSLLRVLARVVHYTPIDHHLYTVCHLIVFISSCIFISILSLLDV